MKLKASEVIDIDDTFLDELVRRIDAKWPFQNSETIRLYTTEEVARIVKRDVGTIRLHIRNYRDGHLDRLNLEAVRHGKRYMITEEALQAYIKHKPDPLRP